MLKAFRTAGLIIDPNKINFVERHLDNVIVSVEGYEEAFVVNCDNAEGATEVFDEFADYLDPENGAEDDEIP